LDISHMACERRRSCSTWSLVGHWWSTAHLTMSFVGIIHQARFSH
jgi:hypothetical protein